jgi:hypothetical protein
MEQNENLLLEGIFNSRSIDEFKSKIKKAIIGGVALMSVITAIYKTNLDRKEKEMLENFARIEAEEQRKADSVYNVKVEACRKYMETALKNQGYNFNSTGLKPETLVREAEKHNFDLPFLMAVVHQESCFGATPRAKKTNSPFSVGSYDDGRNVVTYSDPNESVGDYINLIKRDYLIDGKSILDLLQPNNFINKNGHRYAQDKNYEGKIKYLRDRILKSFPELNS